MSSCNSKGKTGIKKKPTVKKYAKGGAASKRKSMTPVQKAQAESEIELFGDSQRLRNKRIRNREPGILDTSPEAKIIRSQIEQRRREDRTIGRDFRSNERAARERFNKAMDEQYGRKSRNRKK